MVITKSVYIFYEICYNIDRGVIMKKIMDIVQETKGLMFLIPASIMLIIFGIIALVISINNQNYIEVEATITNVSVSQEAYIDTDGNRVDETYKVTVRYMVDERNYNGEIDGVSKYNIGDKMTIYYNPDNPNEITQTKSLILPILFIASGIVLFIGSIIYIILKLKKN